MGAQRTGREERIEGVENSLVLGAVRDMLDHGARQTQRMQLAPQESRQEATAMTGIR